MKEELYFKTLESVYDQFVKTEQEGSFCVLFKIICKEFNLLSPVKSKPAEELNEDRAIYRGVGDKRKHMVNLVCETNQDKIFIGDGHFGKGIYCTNNFKSALAYANENEFNVIKLYLSRCKMIDWSLLYSIKSYISQKYMTGHSYSTYDIDSNISRINETIKSNKYLNFLFDFIDSKGDSAERKKFLNFLLSDTSILAATICYDVVIVPVTSKRNNDIYLILNRGKLSVEKRFHKLLNQNHKRASALENKSKETDPTQTQPTQN